MAVASTEILEMLSRTPRNSQISMRAGVTAQQLDAAMDSLEGKMRFDSQRGQIGLDSLFDRGLTPSQKNGFTLLRNGFAERKQEQAIKMVPGRGGSTVVAPFNDLYNKTGIGVTGVIDRDAVMALPAGTTLAASGEGTDDVSPMHRVGNGYWSWSLSYKWWGVRLSVNHNFLNYLCNNTAWLLGRAGLPGWVSIIIRPLGCLLHSLDTGANGSSISITWAGAFWYTP